jgi:Ca-activated chloride channel family protein
MRITTAFMIFLTSLFSGAGAVGQEPHALRVDVSLVTLDAEVTDATGRPVNTLTRDDFQVYENGVLQDLRSFDSVDTPYNILLLFDCSTSTQPHWPFLLEAMNRFGQTLRPQDRIEIAQFGGGFRILRKWFARTDAAIDVKVDPGDGVCAGTDVYGAMEETMAQLKDVKGRKGSIILTDGAHNGIPFGEGNAASLLRNRYADSVNDKNFQKLLKSVVGSGVGFYFVAVDTDLNPHDYNPDLIYNKQQIRSRIEVLASSSGGRVVYPKKPDEVVKLYEQLAHDLGTSYSLGYAPSNPGKDGTVRKIEVRVRDRALRVRQSRDSYTAQ